NWSLGAVNDAPLANNDSYSVGENLPLSVAAPGVLANDTDAESPTITATLASGPLHGALAFNADGSFSYTPAANYIGADSFTYRASDGMLSSNLATVSLNVVGRIIPAVSAIAFNQDLIDPAH